jgi:hypothetical protein
MEAVLKGSSPGATTAAILLLSRARQLGYPLKVNIAGDPDDITPVHGPAVVYAPVLASCGVGRTFGHGGTVVIPGLDDAPTLVSLQAGGLDSWFEVHRNGPGHHPASQAFYRMSRDPRVEVKKLAKLARQTFEVLGISPHTGLLDFLFQAPVPTLTRIALTLRAGRSVNTGISQPVTQFLSGRNVGLIEPLPAEFTGQEQVRDVLDQAIEGTMLRGLTDSAARATQSWCRLAQKVAQEDDFRDGAFIYAMAELLSHLEQLPAQSILPPLDAALDGVALCLPKALHAVGNEDANQSLREMFMFLGGRYVKPGPHMFSVYAVEAPTDSLKRWQWFCEAATEGRKRADELWPLITDPPS